MSCCKFDKLLLLQCFNRWPRSWQGKLWTQKMKNTLFSLLEKRWKILENDSFISKLPMLGQWQTQQKILRKVNDWTCEGFQLVFWD